MVPRFRRQVSAVSKVLILLLVTILTTAAHAAIEHNTVLLSTDVEMDLRYFPAEGDTMLLGFPCDQGMGLAEEAAGEVLAGRGIEVWLADLLGAHFLPIAPSSMRGLKGGEVARLVEHAVEKSGKHIALTASGYGAIPALRGARIWQKQHPEDRHLLGAILFFPMLSAHNPEPGKPLEYLDIVHQTNLPIVIMQPSNSPNRFWARTMQKALQESGSRVHIEILHGVRSRFYARNDATPEEKAMTERLPDLIERALSILRSQE